MYSLEAIRSMSDEAAKNAAENQVRPYVPFDTREIEGYPPFPFPNIGSYDPLGWEEVDDGDGNCLRLFVDSSGFGRPSEPALTIEQFKNELLRLHAIDSTYGYAIVQEGQFQVYVGVFKRVAEREPMRTVMADDYKIVLYDEERRDNYGKHGILYEFYTPGSERPLFRDIIWVPPSMHSVDSDETLRSVLTFITLRPGDVEDSYFENYTPDQLEWANGDGPDDLSSFYIEFEDGEEQGVFVDIE